MGKKGAEPADPATPPTGVTGRPSGAARGRPGTRSQRGRTPLEELGRLAAREMLRGPWMISTTEMLFALALVYAFVVTALRLHAMHLPIAMTALPY